jgi:hypothetical protein
VKNGRFIIPLLCRSQFLLLFSDDWFSYWQHFYCWCWNLAFWRRVDLQDVSEKHVSIFRSWSDKAGEMSLQFLKMETCFSETSCKSTGRSNQRQQQHDNNLRKCIIFFFIFTSSFRLKHVPTSLIPPFAWPSLLLTSCGFIFYNFVW